MMKLLMKIVIVIVDSEDSEDSDSSHLNFSVTDSYVKISIILLTLKNIYKNSYYGRDNYEKLML